MGGFLLKFPLNATSNVFEKFLYLCSRSFELTWIESIAIHIKNVELQTSFDDD